MYSNTKSAFNEINISLNKVYNYLNNSKTIEQGNELFKNLIYEIINNLFNKSIN